MKAIKIKTEAFFMGKYKFKINEYDFIHLVLNGEKRQGL